MIRVLAFLLLVLGLGFLFSWVADRPGEVVLAFQGYEYRTSLMVAVAATVAAVVALMIVWWLVSRLLRSPVILRRFFRNRRRDRGYSALSDGLIAAGSGDVRAARRLTGESRRLLGREPMVQLLEAQTLLLEGDRKAARDRFTAMLDDDRTRLVALRGLHLEAEREGQPEAARHYVEEAVAIMPALPWAAGALLRYQSLEGDWEGAMATLEAMRASGGMDKAEFGRKRAVLATARAFAIEPKQPDQAARLAQEAHRLAPDLVPAAVIGAQALSRHGDLRRAARMLESVWKKQPHPDIAGAYVHLRSGDSVLDRLKRARKLAALQPHSLEGNFAIAEAALSAQDWEAARAAMTPVLDKMPTERACLVMADIEEGQYGDKGRMRDWLSRAVRAPRDPAWTADGYVSDKWLPVSPITGQLDAFEWRVPVSRLGREIESQQTHDEIAALAEPMQPAAVEEIAEPLPVESPEILERTTSASVANAAREAVEHPVEMQSATHADSAVADSVSDAGSETDTGPDEAGEPSEAIGKDGDKVVQLSRLPDDPGVDPDETKEEDRKVFGLF